MKSTFNWKSRAILVLPCLASIGLISGCGGGGGGSSTPTVPTPYDGTYTTTFTPSDAIPSDGQAPTGALTITNGKATAQTTFYLQKSVVDAVQTAINTGLNNAGYGGSIKDNQVPASITFNGSVLVDGTGKITLTASKKVDVCGTATITIDPTLVVAGTASSGQGAYNITFPDHLTIEVKGHKASVAGTCNNLPLRAGTVAFVR